MVSKDVGLHFKRRTLARRRKNKFNIIPINLTNPVHHGESFGHNSCVLIYIVRCYPKLLQLVDMEWEIPQRKGCESRRSMRVFRSSPAEVRPYQAVFVRLASDDFLDKLWRTVFFDKKSSCSVGERRYTLRLDHIAWCRTALWKFLMVCGPPLLVCCLDKTVASWDLDLEL